MIKLKYILAILALMTTCTTVFAAESQPLREKARLESILNSSESLQNLQTREIIYQLKDKTPQDPGVEEMIVELERRAEEEDAVAMNAMGSAYAKGKFVEKNPDKEEKYFLGAACVGDDVESAAACLNLYGLKRQDPNKPTKESMDWLLGGASGGNAKAQFNLGNCYYSGIGVTKDLIKAAQWYTKAADQGDARAQNNLGICYEFGNGVTKDPVKAFELYTKAAEQGHEPARKAREKFLKKS